MLLNLTPIDNSTAIIITGTVTTITAFFFGKTGVLQKILDFIIGSKKEAAKNHEEIIHKKDMQIESLTKITAELQATCFKLEKDLVLTNTYMKSLLAYMETLMPDGTNPFLAEISKEIRKTHSSNVTTA
jgi:hypothetical protein